MLGKVVNILTMSSTNNDIYLEDLYSPRVLEIMDKGVVWREPDFSLFHVAREALGWCNWLNKNQVPYSGDPYDSAFKAAGALGLEEEFLCSTWNKVKDDDSLIPSALYVGGEIPCWQKLAGLDYSLFSNKCPQDLKAEVSQAIGKHRKTHPNETQPPSRRPDNPIQGQTIHKTATEVVEPNPQEHPPPPPNPSSSVLGADPTPPPTLHPKTMPDKIARDQHLAALARDVLSIAGTPDQHNKVFEGQSKYRIVLDLDSNELQIFARDRGQIPILLDANGNIDHANSKVISEDVRAFEAALTMMRAHQKQATAAVEIG
jgi:hypothetical protein